MKLYNAFEAVIKSFGMEKLTHPLFENSEIAIRFNIGDNGNENYLDENDEDFVVNPDYVSACLNRAKIIYNSLKNDPDILVIDGYLYEDDTIEDFINLVTTATKLPYPEEINKQECFEDSVAFNHICLCWKLVEYNPDELLEKIIVSELIGENSFLISSVYFVCSEDSVLFHLYDDRGADLCAVKVESIEHIYSNLNDMILIEDKEKIDSVFGKGKGN